MSQAFPPIGSFGKQLDLNIRQGATFGPVTLTLKNPDNSAVNLTGSTVRGQIRKRALDTDVVCAFGVTITDATGGVCTLNLTKEVTAAIQTAENPASPDSRYVYDVELLDSAGRVLPLLYGAVTVLREVTR
jgi:hypothetical protein